VQVSHKPDGLPVTELTALSAKLCNLRKFTVMNHMTSWS